jgi:hypothetical protein
MDLLEVIVFAHSHGGGLIDHESLMFLMPTLPLLFVGTVVVAKVLEKRGLLRDDGGTVNLTAALAAIAAGLSVGAAAIHFAVIGEHLAFDLGYGLFFIGLAWFQAMWAQVYLLARTAALAWVGVVVNAAVIVIWIVSRTTGLPFGPTPWIAEPIGTLDLFATAFEACLIVMLLPTAAPRRMASLAARRLAREQAFVLGAFCVLTIVLLATVALLGAPAGEAAQ